MKAPQWVVEKAREIGRLRYRNDIAAGCADQRITKRTSSVGINALGVFGELVIEHLMGVPIKRLLGGPDRGPDVGGIEVKTTMVPRGSLLVPEFDADRYAPDQIFVLVVAAPPWFEVKGWAYAHEFIGGRWEPNRSLPFPAYQLKAEMLHDSWPPPVAS